MRKNNLKYFIIGAGATGGCIAGFLADAGKDVTLLARGRNLEAIRQHGLKIRREDRERRVAVRVVAEEEYSEKADIIFLCVKGYSLEETYSMIRKAAGQETVVIPILNIYGTGERMAKALPGIRVLNGCIYVAASVEEPGILRMGSDIFRIVYGSVDGKKEDPMLARVEGDLREAGITPVYTSQVRRDTLQKYAMVSPMAAVGAFYDIPAGEMQKPGEMRERYKACVREIDSLANAMGIPFSVDVVQTNLDILDHMEPDCTASMQKDLKKGGKSEIDGLIFEPVRMGRRYGVPVPNYEEIAAKFGYHYVDEMTVRRAGMEDLAAVTAVEAACFPEAEAAVEETFRDRLLHFPDHFWLLEDRGKLVAFVNGMVTDEPDLSDAMYADASMHREDGEWQMIFGVCTLPAYRRQGCAATLLQHAIEDARAQGRKGLVLTCKEQKLSYYGTFGFENEGESESAHGGARWYQMRITF